MGRRIEPECKSTTGLAVAVTVERRALLVDNCCVHDGFGLQAQKQFVWARRPPAVAAIGNLRIEAVVARARDRDEVFARLKVDTDQRISTVIVVVPGDECAHGRAADGVFPIQRDQRVGEGRGRARPSGHGLGREGPWLQHVERVEIDVGADRREELPEVDGVVIARKYGLTR